MVQFLPGLFKIKIKKKIQNIEFWTLLFSFLYSYRSLKNFKGVRNSPRPDPPLVGAGQEPELDSCRYVFPRKPDH